MIGSVLAVALLLQYSDVPASTSAAGVQPAPPVAAKPLAPAAKAAPDPNEMICHNQPVTGSRLIKTKVCHTRAEWDQASRDTQQTVGNMENTHGMKGTN